MKLDFLRRTQTQPAPQAKASAAGPVVAWHNAGRVAWTPRDSASLTRSGFAGNPVGFRAVKLIAEAAAALPVVLQDSERRYAQHPVLALMARPNAGQGRAAFLEALFGQVLLSGDGYVEAVTGEDGVPVELHVLRSVVGITETTLPRHPAGRWDLGGPLQVRLISGALESRSREAVLNGANLAAIGDGSSGNWELFQFETAELVDAKTWWLSGRLRGQLGSDALMSQDWPEGSWLVLLNGVPEQIGLSPSQLRIARHYRIGPASRPASDPSYVHRVEAFNGNGLRPYAPAHLCAVRSGGGDLVLNWIRRTRIDGYSWDLAEVPLGEESESYLMRVRQGAVVLREVTLGAPGWSYAAAEQVADGAIAGDVIEVAQVSARYGPGLFAQVVIPA